MEFHWAEQGVRLLVLSDASCNRQVLLGILHPNLLLLHQVAAAESRAGHEDWAAGPEAISHPWDIKEVFGTATRPHIEQAQAEQLAATEDVRRHAFLVLEGYHVLASLVFVEDTAAVHIFLVIAQFLRHVVHLEDVINLAFELFDNFWTVVQL